MEKKPTVSTQEDIRSPIVQAIHEYEQSLNAEVIHLREQLRTEKENRYGSITPLVYRHEGNLKTLEQNLKLFRNTFRSYLPQSPNEEKPKKQEEEYSVISKSSPNDKEPQLEEDREFILFS